MKHSDQNETFFSHRKDESEALARLQSLCYRFGPKLTPEGEELVI